MDSQENLAQRATDFSQLLLTWNNPLPGRGLPWAFESDPYKIWISEIMLQQTQARTVVPFYLKFLARFPNVIELADATLDEVLSIWTGLGYYSRARNLHRAAQLIKSQSDGEFPENFSEILSLPGIGRSTAGAICALAFGMKTPILDGNAKRVYARGFCVAEEKESKRTHDLWNIAQACTPTDRIQMYTQLIMDLGATICTPKNPKCTKCPVESVCCAKLNNLTSHLPLKKRSLPRKTKSTVMIMAIDDSNRLLLERRPATGIWGKLWSFPEYSGDLNDLGPWFRNQYAIQIEVIEKWQEFHHDFTHYRLNITPLLVRIKSVDGDPFSCNDLDCVVLDQPTDRGVPVPVAELIARLVNHRFNSR